jgi:hypothetical protein
VCAVVCVCVCVCVCHGRRWVFRHNARSHAQVVRNDQRELSKSLRRLRTCPCNAPTVSCIRVSSRPFASAQAMIRPKSERQIAGKRAGAASGNQLFSTHLTGRLLCFNASSRNDDGNSKGRGRVGARRTKAILDAGSLQACYCSYMAVCVHIWDMWRIHIRCVYVVYVLTWRIC